LILLLFFFLSRSVLGIPLFRSLSFLFSPSPDPFDFCWWQNWWLWEGAVGMGYIKKIAGISFGYLVIRGLINELRALMLFILFE
jgi:hypothetical protein